MTKETLTIHKALSELKILEDRIEGAMQERALCVANKHSNTKINGVAVADYEKLIQGSYDKTIDLINRYFAIKKAVTKSNAVTTITLPNGEFSVAEAIWMKQAGMEAKKNFLTQMKKAYNAAILKINKENATLDERAENHITGIFGSKENRIATDDIDKARKNFIDANQMELIDPIKINEKMTELEEEISTFEAEIDAAISVSNALTTIEIEY